MRHCWHHHSTNHKQGSKLTIENGSPIITWFVKQRQIIFWDNNIVKCILTVWRITSEEHRYDPFLFYSARIIIIPLLHPGIVLYLLIEAEWRLQPRSSLVQIMACRLFGGNPLSEPMMYYCQLDPWEKNFSQIVLEIKTFSFKKIHLKNIVWKMSAILSRPQCVKEGQRLAIVDID